jgi:hypothetical protein
MVLNLRLFERERLLQPTLTPMNPPTQTFKKPEPEQEELFRIPPRFVPIKLAAQIVGSERILERMIYATQKKGDPWLKVAAGAGKRIKVSLIDYESLMRACDRLLTEQPPKVPSEQNPEYQKEYYLTRTKIRRQEKRKMKYDQHHQGEEVAA